MADAQSKMSDNPPKAVVLAAGLGMRLRPLTLGRPKPLMPLWDVPLLERILRLLEGWGVVEIAVNLHWQPDKICAFLEQRAGPARVCTSYEPEILGTGGALRPLQEFVEDGPFWVVNADIAAHVSSLPLLHAFSTGDGLAAAWLEPKKGPRTVEADRQGRITCYRSPTPGVPGTFTFCGLQLLSPRIFDYLPDRPFCTLVEAYERAMAQGVFVQGVAVKDSYWDDAGTVEAYLRMHGDRKAKQAAEPLEAHRAPRDGGIWVCEKAEVAPDVRGRCSVVYGEAKVQPGSVLKACVVAGGCVGGRLNGVVCVAAADAGDDALPDALAALGWRLDETAASFLGTRGSNRSFWRLYRYEERAIYIRYTLERAENARYGSHARLLAAAGVPVPQVLTELPESRCLVLEDWGDDSLQTRMAAHPERAETWYRPVVQALARLHREGTRRVLEEGIALEAPFDGSLYAWERGLFEEHLLKGRFGLCALPTAAARELEAVAMRLSATRQVLLHRDCQSSNILWRGSRFAFIDFQGLRLGSAAYDLASLLYDPYVKLTPSLRLVLTEEYAAIHPELQEGAAFFHEGAVQRLVQALGAFGRLAAVGQTGFTRYILPALQNLLAAADTCGLDAMGGLAEELIAKELCNCALAGKSEEMM